MKFNREIINTQIEDKILIGLIIFDKFIPIIQSYDIKDFWEGSYHKIVANWCFEYYSKFKKAPKLHIEDIFIKNKKLLEEPTQKNINTFLIRLSNEYEKSSQIQIEYLIIQAQEYFNTQNQKLLNAEISDALDDRDSVENINELIQKYQPIDFSTTSFNDSIITSKDLLQEKVEMPRAIVYPWLRESSLNMIYAKRGLGKSFLALILAISITRKDYDNIDIGPWYVKNPCGVLLCDGEMGKFDLQDRIKQLVGPVGEESKRFPFTIFSTPDYTEDSQESVNLYTPYWQNKVYSYLKTHRSTRVLILDNLSSLCTGNDENDNTLGALFNTWLISLRAMGISVILIHHAGKSGLQRGASVREDPLNNIIVLKKPADWIQGEGCHFYVQFEKARNDPGGKDWSPFALRVVEHDENTKWRQWIQV